MGHFVAKQRVAHADGGRGDTVEMVIVALDVGEIRLLVEEAVDEAVGAAVEGLRLDQAMVKAVGGVGIGAEIGLELVLLLAVDDAVVQLHVEGIVEGLVSLPVDGVVAHHHSVFVAVVLVGVPVVGDGAVHEAVVTAKSPDVGVAAVGNHEVLGLDRVEDGVDAVAALVLDDGVVDAEGALGDFQNRLAADADVAVANDGMADAVVGPGASVHEQDLLPLAGHITVIGFQTVALDHDRRVGGAVDDELAVAPREDAAALVTVDSCSGFNSQGPVAVDDGAAIDDIRPFAGPNRRLQAVGHDGVFALDGAGHLVADDIVGVLSPCQEFDSLRVAVGDKLYFVFHHERRVQVVRVDGDAHEGEEAVFGRDDLVVKLSGILAVHVEAVRGGVTAFQSYRADFQVVAVAVVDSQFVGG